VDVQGLSSIPLFSSLNEDALRKLAFWFSELSVSEGKHLVEEGDYAYDLFFIQEGTAEVKHDGQTVAELGPGDFFGEIGVLKNEQRNATVVAKTPMRLVTLSHWDVSRLRKTAPEVLEQLQGVFEQRSN
jgi:CRP/FNR family transcriptional regulator, cyclic AMP receptor protein